MDRMIVWISLNLQNFTWILLEDYRIFVVNQDLARITMRTMIYSCVFLCRHRKTVGLDWLGKWRILRDNELRRDALVDRWLLGIVVGSIEIFGRDNELRYYIWVILKRVWICWQWIDEIRRINTLRVNKLLQIIIQPITIVMDHICILF